MSKGRTRVKICGITNLEDAMAAIDYGADALGFNYSPDPDTTPNVAHILTFFEREYLFLPPLVTRVVVCMCGESVPSEEDMPFDAIQFRDYSGNIRHKYLKHYIRAFKVKGAASLREIDSALKHRYPDALLLDTYYKSNLDGSGETFNWELAVEVKRKHDIPIILAGGLTPENVGEAIAMVEPFAVDVSTEVEAEFGNKDHGKLKAFINAVREADRQLA